MCGCGMRPSSVCLETKLTEIAIQVVLLAQVRYREDAISHYQWRVERNAELEEEDRRRRMEIEQAERERLKLLEEARIDRLPSDATAFQQASVIREYVAKIQRAQLSSPKIPEDELQRWRRWVLAQADRIDPSLGEIFVAGMREEQN
jgi:hypothetical protein